MRFLFTTAVVPTHLYALVPLAWSLRAAGHDVLVCTLDNFLPTVQRAGLPVTSCGPAMEFAAFMNHDRAGHPVQWPDDVSQRHGAAGRGWARLSAHTLAGTRAVVAAFSPDLVVSEWTEYAGPMAAAAAGLPWVEVRWGVGPLPEYRTAAEDELASELAQLGLRRLPAPRTVLDPWPPSMRLAHAAGHRSVRFVPYDEDACLPGWILSERSRPRICVTLGTVLPRHGSRGGALRFLATLATALASRLDVEVVVGVDDNLAQHWRRRPPGVRHAGWLPLTQAIAVSDLVVHHGGQQTTLTALAAGRPQVVIPHLADQFDNADALVTAGAGIQVPPEQASPGPVARACVDVLNWPAYAAAAAALAEEIGRQPAPAEMVSVLCEVAAQ
jgi:UDP:flavonoid glycosyltransferase YjiC (YdhE family)